MTIKQVREILNSLDEKYNNYPLLIFSQDNQVLSGIIHLNNGQIDYNKENPIDIKVFETRDFGEIKNYMIDASFSVIN